MPQTLGERYGPAMEVTTQGEADRIFVSLVSSAMEANPNLTAEAARQMERENLGYYAGYYGDEVRARVERLFACAHPVFGPIAEGKPTPEEAFRMGVEAAKHGTFPRKYVPPKAWWDRLGED